MYIYGNIRGVCKEQQNSILLVVLLAIISGVHHPPCWGKSLFSMFWGHCLYDICLQTPKQSMYKWLEITCMISNLY